MPAKAGWWELLLIALAAVSGGLGGAAIAGRVVIQGRPLTAAYAASYAIIGMAFGILAAVYGAAVGLHGGSSAAGSVIGAGVIAGMLGAAGMAGANFSIRWILARLGLEVEIQVRPTERRRPGQ